MTKRRGRGEGSIYWRKDGSENLKVADHLLRMSKPKATRGRLDPNGSETAEILSNSFFS